MKETGDTAAPRQSAPTDVLPVSPPEQEPGNQGSRQVQLVTVVFYALAVAGLTCDRAQEPQSGAGGGVEARECTLAKLLLTLVLGLGFVLSLILERSHLFAPVAVDFVFWTPLGFLLTAFPLAKGIRERWAPARDNSS